MMRIVGFGLFSLAAHLAIGSVCLLFASQSESADTGPRLIDISLDDPALGQPHGSQQGKGLGSHVEAQRPAAQAHANPSPPPPPVAPDPEAFAPPLSTATARPQPSSTSKAVASAAPTTSATSPTPLVPTGNDPLPGSLGGGDPNTPAGSANVPPALGDPSGREGGQGTGKGRPRLTHQYAAILGGWFAARLNVRGLDIPPEELGRLRVNVQVSLSPDRHVTGYSIGGSSGNAAFDEAVRRTMSTIQGSGVTLPPPPEGSEVPASIPILFRPNRINH